MKKEEDIISEEMILIIREEVILLRLQASDWLPILCSGVNLMIVEELILILFGFDLIYVNIYIF